VALGVDLLSLQAEEAVCFGQFLNGGGVLEEHDVEAVRGVVDLVQVKHELNELPLVHVEGHPREEVSSPPVVEALDSLDERRILLRLLGLCPALLLCL